MSIFAAKKVLRKCSEVISKSSNYHKYLISSGLAVAKQAMNKLLSESLMCSLFCLTFYQVLFIIRKIDVFGSWKGVLQETVVGDVPFGPDQSSLSFRPRRRGFWWVCADYCETPAQPDGDSVYILQVAESEQLRYG
jgi:hypothetical protein